MPSAFDNRPLNFEEYDARVNQVIYVSATPGEFERTNSSQIVEQIIRPTGLLDPEISVRPTEGQIDDLLSEINKRVAKKERVLVVTVTKKLAESLADYLGKMDIRVRYLHHDIETLDRIQILKDLRSGDFDVLVGINLLREGLDLPEVSLVAILDADKQGFLRNETSLIQIIGRAARNAEGKVIMYGDSVTPAMEGAIRETERRRGIQMEYNKAHGIVPKTIVKKVDQSMTFSTVAKDMEKLENKEIDGAKLSADERRRLIETLSKEMTDAAKILDFEYAAKLRDEIRRLKGVK